MAEHTRDTVTSALISTLGHPGGEVTAHLSSEGSVTWTATLPGLSSTNAATLGPVLEAVQDVVAAALTQHGVPGEVTARSGRTIRVPERIPAVVLDERDIHDGCPGLPRLLAVAAAPRT